jgi:hypothetical protein
MYWNIDGRRFVDVTMASGLGHLQKGHAVVFADLDLDGDQDIFEQLGGAYLGDEFNDGVHTTTMQKISRGSVTLGMFSLRRKSPCVSTIWNCFAHPL